MRRAAAFAILLALAGQAAAEYAPVTPRHVKHTDDFWRDVIDPHAEEVDDLIIRVRDAMQRAESSVASDLDLASQETRAHVYDDLFHILTYARRLSPSDTRVLLLLGRVDVELGKMREAAEAFQAIVALVGPDKAGSEPTGRLGLVYLELGQLDDAVRWLRVSVASTNVRDPTDYYANWDGSHARVHLATALALRGEHHSAIEVLSTPAASQNGEASIVQFALAVQFDRDDQRGAAFEVIDRMQSQLSTGYASDMQLVLAQLPFSPPEDRHYYQALFYETIDQYAEARAEWVIYASTGDSPYRARALEHVALIDARKIPVVHAPGIRVPPQYPVMPTRYPRRIRVTP